MREVCKKTLFTALLLAIMVAMTSCVSSTAQTKSEEDCDYVLHLVLDQTQTQTISDLFLFLNSNGETFVPDSYSFLLSKRNSIPGMDLLLRQWAESTLTFMLSHYEIFSAYAAELTQNLQFHDPVGMVDSSDSSISEFYRQVHGQQMIETVRNGIGNLDITVWNRIVTQYRAWTATRAKLYGEQNPEIGEQDIVDLISQLLVDLYFQYFAKTETLIRTTPDPDMTTLQAEILGLD